MKKLGAITVVIALTAGPSFGLTFMGPPTNTLKTGYSGTDFDYTFSESDIKVQGYGTRARLDEVELHSTFARFGYGINDNWECFVRLGLAVAEGSPIDGDIEFAWGLGTKATFHKQENLRIGGLFQVQWFEHDDHLGIGGNYGEAEIDIYEIQVAIGAACDVSGLKVYAGPFLNSVGGDLHIKAAGKGLSYDIEEDSEVGGYVGLATEIKKYFNLCLEYQFTSDAYGIGIGTTWLF